MRRVGYILLLGLLLALASCSSKKSVAIKPAHSAAQVVPSTDKQVAELIRQARTWIGTPYVYGGHTRKKGTDCSGMIMELFQDVYSLKLPRSSAMQREYSRPVKFDDMRPGDLVFFTTNKNSSRINHVGLYVGDNRMIHASNSRGVMESGLGEKYWQNVYHSSGSVLDRNPQKIYDALDEQIDSIYVSDPAIFD